jgi:hypothetical protein
MMDHLAIDRRSLMNPASSLSGCLRPVLSYAG